MSTHPTAWDRLQVLLGKRSRAWATFTARQRKLGAALDPRTGGDAGLIHNWGNEAARAAMLRGWARWHAYSDASNARYRVLCKAHVMAGR